MRGILYIQRDEQGRQIEEPGIKCELIFGSQLTGDDRIALASNPCGVVIAKLLRATVGGITTNSFLLFGVERIPPTGENDKWRLRYQEWCFMPEESSE